MAAGMSILGVDPGLTRCGLGIIQAGRARSAQLVAVDVLRTPAQESLDVRLGQIADHFDRWLDTYRPDVVVIERVFARSDVSTIMGTAQVSGLAMGLSARRGIPVDMHTPSEVKAAITGNGRADKQQVTHMVTRILRLPQPPKPADAADALALAITHLWRGAQAGVDVKARQRAGQSSDGLTAAQRQWIHAREQAGKTRSFLRKEST